MDLVDHCKEELINRLEQTIADFHEEVSEMMANLKKMQKKDMKS